MTKREKYSCCDNELCCSKCMSGGEGECHSGSVEFECAIDSGSIFVLTLQIIADKDFGA